MATLRVFGDVRLTSAHVAEVLGLEPTTGFEAGDPVGRRSTAIRRHSGWLLQSSDNPEDSLELAEAIARVLAVVEPMSRELWQLHREGYEIDWFCYLGSHAGEHAAELDRATLQRVVALPGNLLIDAYGEEPETEGPVP